MKNTLNNNPLQITINPGTVYISTNPDQSSFANITVTLQNAGGSPLSVDTIAITLPAALAPASTLNSITPVASQVNLWNFAPSIVATGEFDADSQSGNNVTMNPGDTWQFTLQMVTLVSTIIQPLAAVTTTAVFGDGSTTSVPLNVNIAATVASIGYFNAKPSNINPGELATLNWHCEAINYCIISPIATTHQAASGSLPVNPNATTIYTLYAYGEGVILSAQWAISVANPVIISFGGTAGQKDVDYNNNIMLVWKCNQFTNSITITNDSGIAIPPLNVPPNTAQQGSISVGPISQETTFTLTAYGTNVQDFVENSALIGINDTATSFLATPDGGIWQKDKVTLTWAIESASAISVSPPVPNGPSLQNLSGSADIYPEADVTYILTVTGFKNNMPVSNQFPVPLTVTPVVINGFYITPPLICPDVAPNQAQLSWNTQAQVASLDNGIGNVQPTGLFNINNPPGGAVYTLTAGTLQNPAIATTAVTVATLCGPYNFNVLAQPPIPGFAVEIENPANLSNLLADSIYNVALTGVVPVSGPPPAAYSGAFVQYDNITFFFLSSSSPVNYTWADPNNPSGTITLLSSAQPGYAAPSVFTSFEGTSADDLSIYSFPITIPAFAGPQAGYCVQLSGVVPSSTIPTPYYTGYFSQYGSSVTLLIIYQGNLSFAWADPGRQSGTITFLGMFDLNQSPLSATKPLGLTTF